MSKLVNWGHSTVAVLFALSGIGSLWAWIERIPTMFHQHPRQITYSFVGGSFLWVVTFLYAWGIFKWRPWARMLGIVLSALCFAVYAVSEFDLGKLDWGIALALIYCAMLFWLLLPVVRAEYMQRNQIA